MGEFCHTTVTLWRNGSASDSRSEGCVFKSRQGHLPKIVIICVDHTHFCERQLVVFGRIEDCSRWGANSQPWHCSAVVPMEHTYQEFVKALKCVHTHTDTQTNTIMQWPRGPTVARLTPDQKVACSNHVGVSTLPTCTARSLKNWRPCRWAL